MKDLANEFWVYENENYLIAKLQSEGSQFGSFLDICNYAGHSHLDHVSVHFVGLFGAWNDNYALFSVVFEGLEGMALLFEVDVDINSDCYTDYEA